jgi:L-fuconolactonase
MHRRDFIKKGGLACSALVLQEGSSFFMREPFSGDDKCPTIDTHLHLWDLDHLDYPWLKDAKNPLSRNFLLADYHKATAGLSIEKMVFVECGRNPEQYLMEVDWVKGIREKDHRIAGMVAYFPLEKGNSGINAMETLAERNIVKGIRKGFMPGNSGFLEGISLLKNFGWSYDLNIGPADLPAAFEFAKSYPDQVIVLDHIANPDIRNNDWKTWEKAITPFSSLENVKCKISGMLTKTDPSKSGIGQMEPYFNTVLEVFGIDRVVFGGDWPVLLRAASYPDWKKAFDTLASHLTVNERSKLYQLNATTIYRL